MLRKSIQLALISLAFTHQNDVVHTGYLDISTNIILQGIKDTSILCQIEDDELTRPIARKILDDREIYFSRLVPLSAGLPVLSDFGEARIGATKQKGDIMPGIYRAPEVILDMEWDNRVDIWSIGVMVTFGRNGITYGASASRVSPEKCEIPQLLGYRSYLCPSISLLVDISYGRIGNWKGSIPIPEQSFEMRAQRYHGDNKELFVQFPKRIMCWLPEARPSAEKLAYDEFLMQPIQTRTRSSHSS
ncbi:uncharacterized protein N7483_003652 [Penicillium malachiteum]|uniref:uncharacterized protein n=1 Tax=Penicillium malachiteum TaxID=1324776 RepID=UPI002547E582|nr:uncharacterized protein N7483_003652 [Penicillium malachiteum]KAJ5729144.1 hypothetical protein N7483_003652 [Penicillium malachiteum]